MKHIDLPPFPLPRSLPALSAALVALDIALVPATLADVPLLASLYAASRMPALFSAPRTIEQKRAFLDDQFALQHVHYLKVHRKGDFCLIVQSGAPVGRFLFDRSARDWVVIDILLATSAQGRGLGSVLIGWFQEAARSAGANGVRLSVGYDNPRAQALYHRLGFVDDGDIGGTHKRMRWRG